MAEETTQKVKVKTFDAAYGFSFSIAVGLLLFLAGLIVTLTVGKGTSTGLIFGVPLIAAGVVLPLFMMRDLFKMTELKGPCPNCGDTLRTSDATLQLKCPSCNQVINVREGEFFLVG